MNESYKPRLASNPQPALPEKGSQGQPRPAWALFRASHDRLISLKASFALGVVGLWALALYLFYFIQHRQYYVFAYLLESYTITWENLDSISLGIGALGLLAYWAVGHFILDWFDLYLPRSVRFCLAFVAGLTVLTVVYELLTMVHLLYRVPVIAIWAATLIVCAYAARRRQKRPLAGMKTEDPDPIVMREAFRKQERDHYASTLLPPRGILGHSTHALAALLTAVLVLLTFYHGVLFPPTYWDTLILYLGYARNIFSAHAFPFKAEAQVGIGLGANYPHLFPLMVATIATGADRWSTLYGQLASPFAGLLSTILLYHIFLRLCRSRVIAMQLALLFRALPYGLAYFTYASDYSFAILYTVAFLYLALLYIETGLFGYLALAALTCAGAVHINYLMWSLWLLWGALVVLAHCWLPRDLREDEERPAYRFDPTRDQLNLRQPPAFTFIERRPPLFALFTQKSFWVLLVCALALSSTWYIRNRVLTGNPVYAFFPNIFGGVRINPEVLDSATREWIANGDGVAPLGDTLAARIVNSCYLFLLEPQGWDWKFMPTLFALSVPGWIFFILYFLWRLVRSARKVRNKPKRDPFVFDDELKFGVLSLLLLVGMLFYEYCIAGYYLYQILPALPALIVGAYFILTRAHPTFARPLFTTFVLLTALIPGLTMGLMGFKFKGRAEISGTLYSQGQLVAFRNPLMDPHLFHRLVYGDDVKMWDFVNQWCKKKKILTHENRHLVFDETITFVHLDDWEVQKLWDRPPDEVLKGLQKLDVAYYLFVPNERNHAVIRRLGIERLTGTPSLELVFKSGENALYQFHYDAQPASQE